MGAKEFSGRLVAAASIVLAIFGASADAVAQPEKVLHSFTGSDGYNPIAGLILDASGNLYGTTSTGGTYGWGAIFEVTPDSGGGWTEAVLHSFNNDGVDGHNPAGRLVFDASGNLYGTTTYGGAFNGGTAFELTPGGLGGWDERVLYNFSPTGASGGFLVAGLVIDAHGNLYGTASEDGKGTNCGSYRCGTVFELIPQAGGTSWTEKILHTFSNDGTDGWDPEGELVLDATGNVYGTTARGGVHSSGAAFELTYTHGHWTETILYSFNSGGADGTYPFAGIIFDATGRLYGTTYSGGTYGEGTVYVLSPQSSGTWNEKVLYSFAGGEDGAHPSRALLSSDALGNLYGTTINGGAVGNGTAFVLTLATGGAWKKTELTDFSGGSTNGRTPDSGVRFDSRGNLYGTTYYGGVKGIGTVFEIMP